MNYPFPVSRGQAAGYLLHDVDCLDNPELAALLEQLVKVISLDELHGDELHTLGFAQVVDPNHIAVGDL